MNYINYKSKKLYLDNRKQVGTLGDEFICIGGYFDTTKPQKWIEGSLKSIFVYRFRYLKDRSKGFDITIGYNDEFISLNKC